MALLDYVASYDDIRALLGVSDDEIDNATLGLILFARSLDEGFNDLDDSLGQPAGTLASYYSGIASVAEASRTAAQKRFFANVQTYAAFHVAGDLVDTLPQFSPKTISDGKAMVQRHADGPYKITIDGVRLGKARALSRLSRAFQTILGQATTGGTGSVIVGLVISSPTSDPVTGT